MKQRCDDLFYTIVMNIKVKRILEEEKNAGWDWSLWFTIAEMSCDASDKLSRPRGSKHVIGEEM